MMYDNWENYYTPKNISRKIIESIPCISNPNQIADICVGSGNLIEAAQQRWPNAKILALDINNNAVIDFKQKYNNSVAECLDATNFVHLTRFFQKSKSFYKGCDLVVANPPFGYFNGKINYTDQYFQDPTIKHLYYEANKLKRIEGFMLISNLLFLCKGGIFAAIIPENFFSSERWHTYRKIFTEYLFDNIYVSDRSRFFKNLDVITRIYIGKLKTNLPKVNGLTGAAQKTELVKNIQIYRGVFTKVKTSCSKSEIPVFHTDCIKFLRHEILPPSNRRVISKKMKCYNPNATLRSNDIVITRVGKNCGFADVIEDKYVGWHISDCIFIVRQSLLPSGFLSKLLRKKLLELRKGLTVQYITKSDVLNTIKIILNERARGVKGGRSTYDH